MPNIIQFRLYLTKLLQKKTVPLFYGSQYIYSVILTDNNDTECTDSQLEMK